MPNAGKLAEVGAMLAERDDDFRPLEAAAVAANQDEPLWALTELKRLLGYAEDESIQKAVDKAKIAASTAGWMVREHFRKGDLFGKPDEVYLTKYAAFLVTVNADVRKEPVAIAQAYFALQVNKQALENEKRIKTRLEVVTENNKLSGIAQTKGVQNFAKFHGMGVSALYGGRNVVQINWQKRIPKGGHFLDFAGSEELAANLFRITQTTAALRRQEEVDEQRACDTHASVGTGVRAAIRNAGNVLPENLPAATEKIDHVATKLKKELRKSRQAKLAGKKSAKRKA